MKNVVLILATCMSCIFFLLSCQEDPINEVAEESPVVEFDIPDSLAVYEMVNGERKRSTTVRLLTNAEKQKLIEKGAVGQLIK